MSQSLSLLTLMQRNQFGTPNEGAPTQQDDVSTSVTTRRAIAASISAEIIGMCRTISAADVTLRPIHEKKGNKDVYRSPDLMAASSWAPTWIQSSELFSAFLRENSQDINRIYLPPEARESLARLHYGMNALAATSTEYLDAIAQMQEIRATHETEAVKALFDGEAKSLKKPLEKLDCPIGKNESVTVMRVCQAYSGMYREFTSLFNRKQKNDDACLDAAARFTAAIALQ
jgi:DNA-binding TFAR19-related protein (PDSD5 family)